MIWLQGQIELKNQKFWRESIADDHANFNRSNDWTQIKFIFEKLLTALNRNKPFLTAGKIVTDHWTTTIWITNIDF